MRLGGYLPIRELLLYPRSQAMDIDGLRSRAAQGSIKDQYCLGVAYDYGLGVKRDCHKALHFYLKIADLGGSDDDSLLSEALESISNGYGRMTMAKYRKAASEKLLKLLKNPRGKEQLHKDLPADQDAVVFWYEIKAEQGETDAQYSMGLLCGKQEENTSRAFFWFKKAALQGDAGAQYELGKCFSKGLGCEPSREQSLYWYEQAAAQGHSSAQSVLADKYMRLGESQKPQARYWTRKLAEQGDTQYQALLGDMLRDGDGGPIDLQEAYAWYATCEAGWTDLPRAKQLRLVAARMNEGQRKDARMLAAEYKKKYLVL